MLRDTHRVGESGGRDLRPQSLDRAVRVVDRAHVQPAAGEVERVAPLAGAELEKLALALGGEQRSGDLRRFARLGAEAFHTGLVAPAPVFALPVEDLWSAAAGVVACSSVTRLRSPASLRSHAVAMVPVFRGLRRTFIRQEATATVTAEPGRRPGRRIEST